MEPTHGRGSMGSAILAAALLGLILTTHVCTADEGDIRTARRALEARSDSRLPETGRQGHAHRPGACAGSRRDSAARRVRGAAGGRRPEASDLHQQPIRHRATCRRGVDRYVAVLAAVIHHEAQHLNGASEPEARRAETAFFEALYHAARSRRVWASMTSAARASRPLVPVVASWPRDRTGNRRCHNAFRRLAVEPIPHFGMQAHSDFDMTRARSRSGQLRGTLDVLVLKALSLEPRHGVGVFQRIIRSPTTPSKSARALFPALHRLEARGWLDAEWRASDLNRQAKFYRLTRAGKKQLEREEREWRRIVSAVMAALESS